MEMCLLQMLLHRYCCFSLTDTCHSWKVVEQRLLAACPSQPSASQEQCRPLGRLTLCHTKAPCEIISALMRHCIFCPGIPDLSPSRQLPNSAYPSELLHLFSKPSILNILFPPQFAFPYTFSDVPAIHVAACLSYTQPHPTLNTVACSFSPPDNC